MGRDGWRVGVRGTGLGAWVGVARGASLGIMSSWGSSSLGIR